MYGENLTNLVEYIPLSTLVLYSSTLPILHHEDGSEKGAFPSNF